jgi:hypothetical protein
MSDKTPLVKRAAQAAALTVGGGVALAFAFAGTASADEVVAQDATVTNAGVGVANSGGNVAVGNASDNTATSGQAAVGGVASNSGGASNHSNGTASITTGSATAVGNDSTTTVGQAVAPPATPAPALVVASQHADVTNAGAGVGNSGGNLAVGNASDNTARSGQLAVGLVASNAGGASNRSDGTASIATGNATGIGNQSTTAIGQAVAGGKGPGGLAVIVQDSSVDNLGLGVANSGGNLAVGNDSDNLAQSLQGAFGLVASNAGGASNASNGSGSIKTGNATGIGNRSTTLVGQGAAVTPGGLAVVLQSAPVLNAGLGLANSGLNATAGNLSSDTQLLIQVAFGLIASNSGNADSWSNGFAFVGTGSATGIGNDSTTAVKQYTV